MKPPKPHIHISSLRATGSPRSRKKEAKTQLCASYTLGLGRKKLLGVSRWEAELGRGGCGDRSELASVHQQGPEGMSLPGSEGTPQL